MSKMVTCPECIGAGYILEITEEEYTMKNCSTCNGRKQVSEQEQEVYLDKLHKSLNYEDTEDFT